MLQLTHIDLAGTRYEGPIDIGFGFYVDDEGNPFRLAITLTESSEGFPQPLATVTVNIPSQELSAETAVFVKDYSENTGVLEAFVQKGWLIPTGESVPSGWVMVPEAVLAGDLLEEARAFAQGVIEL